jgi:hypothetical protein
MPGERERLEAVQADLRAQEATLSVPIEGSSDYIRVNINDPTRTVISSLYEAHLHRARLVRAAIAAVQQLLDDNYAEIPRLTTTPEILLDLQAQILSMQAALSYVDPIAQATHVDIGNFSTPTMHTT